MIKMLFKKLYYYYHHYKMWSYIVKQLGKHPEAQLSQLKSDYIEENNCKHLAHSDCFLCSYAISARASGEKACPRCPLYKKYGKSCFAAGSLFYRVYMCKLREERIAAAEKIRDCVLPWKSKMTNEEIKED